MSKERRHLFRKIPLIQICFDTLQMESSHWSVALQYKQIRIPHKDLQLHSLSYKILPHAHSVLLYVTILQDEGKTLCCIVCIYIEVKWGLLFKIGSPWTPRCFRPTRQSWRFWREGKVFFVFFPKHHQRFTNTNNKTLTCVCNFPSKGLPGRPGLPGADGLPGPPGTVLMLPVSKIQFFFFFFQSQKF